MKGMMFSEFIEWVERTWSPDVADAIIDNSEGLSNGGAYTGVGTYPHQEMLTLVGALSAEVGQPAPEIVHAFGRAAFGRLAEAHPGTMIDCKSAFQLLSRLDAHIHPEVRKLYPDAEVPQFEAFEKGDTLELLYRSSRPFADLAAGLIEGCGLWFEQPLQVAREDLDDGATRFVVTRTS